MSASHSDPLPRSADVVIVGGGVIGAATAFYARRAGLRAVIVERRPALATLSTAAATGAFRLQFDNREELELVRESVDVYRRFAEVTGLADVDLDLRTQGYLWVATREETARLQRERVERQRGWGLVDVELLEGAELRRRFPFVAPDALQARFRAGDGWLAPRAVALGFARASGASVALETAVERVAVEGGRVTGVRTSRGTIAAPQVVIAAGPFSARLAAAAGVSLPLALVRRHRLVLPHVPAVPQDAPMTIDEETGAHWRPAHGGAHLMWPDPGELAGPPRDDVPASESFAFAVLDPGSPSAVARIAPFWRRVWEGGAGQWLLRAGQYDVTPDHRPLIGATPLPGLFVHCGYSGHGVMAAAGGGRRLVEALAGRLPADHPFAPDRHFAERPRDVL